MVPGGRAPEAVSARRDPLLDNAKALLITLVVLGHAVEPLRGTAAADGLYFWVYSFHMPAFILVSGYLSRSFDGAPHRLDRLVVGVGLPYLAFWVIQNTERWALGTDGVRSSPLDPVWTLWFLVALFVWRLSVPVWRRLRAPVAVAVGVSMAVALVGDAGVLDLHRVLGLLPFFVLGLALRPEHLERLRRTPVRVAAAVALLAAAAAAVPLADALGFEWVYWRAGIGQTGIGTASGMLIRSAFLAGAAVLSLAVVALVPRRRGLFTRLGEASMYVYLGHAPLLVLLRWTGFYEAVPGPAAGIAAAAAVTAALLAVLASPFFRAATRWIVEPDVRWPVAGKESGNG